MLSNLRIHLRQQWLTDLFFLVLVLGFFYTFWLGSYPLFTPDEGRYSEVAREMIVTGDFITPRLNGIVFLDKPILYYWLQASAIKLFGLHEWALRFWPAFFGVLGCAAAYLAGRIIFNRRAGLLAAICLSTNPLYFGASHYANLDLEVAVLISCALFSFIIGTQLQRSWSQRSAFLASFAFIGLAALTKGLIGIAFPGMIISAWVVLLWRWELLKRIPLVTGFALLAAIVLPWYWLAQKANPEFFHFFFVTQQVTRFLAGADFNNKAAFWFYIPIVILGFFPWSIFAFQAIIKSAVAVFKNRQQHAPELFFLLWFFIIFIFFSIPRSKTIGYILPVLPALAMLTGYYIDQALEKVQSKGFLNGFRLFIIATLLVGAFFIILPTMQWMKTPAEVFPYLYLAGSLSIVAAITIALLFRKAVLALGSITLFACAFLLILTASATPINNNTIKPLALELKTIIKPDDEVIAYFKYYQDLPLYLEKRIAITADWDSDQIAYKDNWTRELWYGMNFKSSLDTPNWLINEKTFWDRWGGEKRVFALTNKNYFREFESKAKGHVYYKIQTLNDIVLVSNRPA